MNAPARIAELERQLHWAQLEIQALREELRQRRIQQLGPKSETLEQPATGSADRGRTQHDTRRGGSGSATRAVDAPRPRTGTDQPHPGRKPLPEDLPRITRRHCLQRAHVRVLRRGDGGDRLRRKRATGCRAGALFRARDQAREASLPALLDGDGGAAGGAHRRKGIGERCGGDPHSDGEVLRSPAVVPASGDAGARSGRRDRTRDAGWLGDARGRIAGAHRGSDAAGSARRILFTG